MRIHSDGRKRFAEHGYVVGLALFRPHAHNTELDVPLDGTITSVDHYLLNDDDVDYWGVNQVQVTSSTSSLGLAMPRKAWLHRGQHLIGGGGKTWCLTHTPADVTELTYLAAGNLPIGSELGTKDYAAYTEFDMEFVRSRTS